MGHLRGGVALARGRPGGDRRFDGREIVRAGVEDHFCGKLLGVPMGVDICYTNHADADQGLRRLRGYAQDVLKLSPRPTAVIAGR